MQLKDKPIALTGFMGSGKSTVGKALALELGYRFVDLDEFIVTRTGKSIPEIFTSGEVAFRKEEFEALRDLLNKKCNNLVIALGGGCITNEQSRELVLTHCASIYLHASLDCIRKRIGDSDSNRPLFHNADSLYQQRAPLYAQADISVDTENKSVPEIVAMIVKALEIN